MPAIPITTVALLPVGGRLVGCAGMVVGVLDGPTVGVAVGLNEIWGVGVDPDLIGVGVDVTFGLGVGVAVGFGACVSAWPVGTGVVD